MPPVDDRERFRRLVETGIQITSELSLDSVLSRLVDAAAELADARYAALGVLDRSGETLERFLEFAEAFYFDLDEYFAVRDCVRLGERLANAAGGDDVIFLDEDAVAQRKPVILPASQRDCPFFKGAQTRRGFTCIENPGWEATNRGAKLRRERRDP